METDLNERESPPCRAELARLVGENRQLGDELADRNRQIIRLKFELDQLENAVKTSELEGGGA